MADEASHEKADHLPRKVTHAIELVKNYSLYSVALVVLSGISYLFVEREKLKAEIQFSKDHEGVVLKDYENHLAFMKEQYEIRITELRERLEPCGGASETATIRHQLETKDAVIASLAAAMVKSR